MENLLGLGVGGIFAILILKEVLGFLKKRTNGNSLDNKIKRMFIAINEVKEYSKDLYDMHNQKDNDGVYIWYVRRSLEEAITKLADNIQHQTDCFRDLVMKLDSKIKN